MNTAKKTAAILAILLMLCASGGRQTKSAKPVSLSEDFSEKGKIIQEDFECEADFRRGGDGTWEIEFSSPDSISGMKVKCSGDICSVDFMELSYSMDRGKLPESSMISLITKAADELISQKDLTCSQNGKTVTEKGIVSGQDFTAEFNDENIKKLEIAKNLTVEFT